MSDIPKQPRKEEQNETEPAQSVYYTWYSIQLGPGTCLYKKKKTEEEQNENCYAQRGARTHDPEIKSLVLYRLS